jgi:hypothetical protein
MISDTSLIGRVIGKAQDLLKGEPLRAITYGGAVVIYLVARAVGAIPDVSIDQAIIQSGAAAVALVGLIETARKFVYSKPTVERIAEASAATGVATVPAPPASDAPAVTDVADSADASSDDTV